MTEIGPMFKYNKRQARKNSFFLKITTEASNVSVLEYSCTHQTEPRTVAVIMAFHSPNPTAITVSCQSPDLTACTCVLFYTKRGCLHNALTSIQRVCLSYALSTKRTCSFSALTSKQRVSLFYILRTKRACLFYALISKWLVCLLSALSTYFVCHSVHSRSLHSYGRFACFMH